MKQAALGADSGNHGSWIPVALGYRDSVTNSETVGFPDHPLRQSDLFQQPVECIRRPMLNNSSPGQAIYEPFLGSGTTLIAAQSCGRTCFAIDSIRFKPKS